MHLVLEISAGTRLQPGTIRAISCLGVTDQDTPPADLDRRGMRRPGLPRPGTRAPCSRLADFHCDPDDCERFQHQALQLPKNWRSKYLNSKQDTKTLSANTVLKWSVALQAAFERANQNAERKKCVRGVVP